MPQIANIALMEQPHQFTLAIEVLTKIENLPEEIGEAYARISEYLSELGELMAGVPYVCFHNMDMENLRAEIGFPVVKPIPGNAGIEAHIIPQQKVVYGVHLGPYHEMTPLYEAMGKWIYENGFEPVGPVYEYYLNDPDRPESELVTKVIMPVK